MGTKTIWVECRMGEGEEPCFFPGHNVQHATARAFKFFAALSIPSYDLIMREYIPRSKVVTKRKLKRKHAKHAISVR